MASGGGTRLGKIISILHPTQSESSDATHPIPGAVRRTLEEPHLGHKSVESEGSPETSVVLNYIWDCPPACRHLLGETIETFINLLRSSIRMGARSFISRDDARR